MGVVTVVAMVAVVVLSSASGFYVLWFVQDGVG